VAVVAAFTCALALVSAGCATSPAARSSSSAPASAAHSAADGSRAVASPQIEMNPPGDIPDNQAFVPYRGAGFSVAIPEGWAKTTTPNAVAFTDKYNSVTITVARSQTAPTVATVKSAVVPTIESAAKGFVFESVTAVQRRAGAAILVAFKELSPVNAVTGKVTEQAVQHYEFWRQGTLVTLTLAGPVGADNVDPWRTVTDSFAWA